MGQKNGEKNTQERVYLGHVLVVVLPAPRRCKVSPGHGLGEVDVDPTVVNQDLVHFEECLFGTLLRLKLNEGVLKAVPCLLVFQDLTGFDLAEAREDELEVLLRGDGVELADKEDVPVWSDLSIRDIT